MNLPPAKFLPLQPDQLRSFSTEVLNRAGVPAEQATLLASLLVTNDLRGVFSHGTRQILAYVDHFRAGRLTAAPEIRVVNESPTTLVVDGGGGLGYFPAHKAATLLGAKAEEMGIAAALTRNHGHIGAAGIYARIPLERSLFCYVTSGHQLDLRSDQSVLSAAGGSPMSFAIPTRTEPPFVLDFGAVHDMYPGSKCVAELIRIAPGTVFRSVGLGAVCQSLGGFLAGVPLDPNRAVRQWSGANQGSFLIAVDLRRFGDLEQFLQETDEYSRRVRSMRPLTGFDQAYLPGGIEWEREQEYSRTGIPISADHAEALRKLAGDYGLPAPL